MEKLDRRDSNADPLENDSLEGNIVEMAILRAAAALHLAGDARRWNVKLRGVHSSIRSNSTDRCGVRSAFLSDAGSTLRVSGQPDA